MERNSYSDILTIAANQNIKEKEYWLNKLSGDLPGTIYPYDYNRNEGDGYNMKEFKFSLDGEIFTKLKHLSKEQDPTLYLILIAGLVAVLNKHLDSSDIILGTPIYKPAVEGDFINTVLTLRNHLRDNITFKELLIDVKRTVIQVYENQDYPIEVLVKELNLEWKPNRFPLFDIAVLLTNIHDKKHLQPIRLNLIFSFSKTNEHLECVLEYNSLLYFKSTAERIANHLENFFQAVLFDPGKRIAEVEIMSEEEKRRVIVEFNRTRAEYPGNVDIYSLFEEQVEKHPGRKALTCEDKQLTFRELDRSAGGLAGGLRERGVGPNTIVGIMAERSVEMFVAIFGILKAGGAYLPINPDYPQERQYYMLRDSGAKILLTGQEIVNYTSPLFSSANSNAHLQLAYAIYTSGSTGKPKGVIIEHSSLVNRLNWMQKKYPLTARDIILHKTPFTFDVSVWEIFWWALTGAGVCLLHPGGEKFPEVIVNTTWKTGVTLMHFVPSMLNAFLDYIKDTDNIRKLSGLKQVIASGEALTLPQVDLFNRLLYERNKTHLANLYGPTEATIDVSYFDCSNGQKLDRIPIGKPIDNIRLFILNKQGRLLPPGIPGQLCIAGVGLARGYLNRPELTAEKFDQDKRKKIPDQGIYKSYRSHMSNTPKRLYKTGDLARWLQDGNVEFLGRIDQQVKIRGFRIELGEIENRLLKHEHIKNVVVIAKEGKEHDKYLTAYIVASPELAVSQLNGFLSKELPAYMIPSYFVQIPRIPLTSNGKIDRRQLPGPDVSSGEEYVPPGNKFEEELTDIWQDILESGKIGVNDNFFNTGGDSIKAIRLVSLINNQFHANIKVLDLFNNNTIRQLARVVKSVTAAPRDKEWEEAEKEVAELKTQIMKSGKISENAEDILPMSNIQKGMIFYSLKNPDQAVYHDQFVYHRQYPMFQPDLFKRALELMTEKHPILKTSYNVEDFDEFIHLVHKAIPLAYKHFDIAGLEQSKQEQYIVKYMEEDRNNRWNVTVPPLWRMATFTLDKENICGVWSFHHSILDGWSNASLMTELNNAYLELKAHGNFNPGRLKVSYRDFIIQEVAENKRISNINFWKKELENYKRISFHSTSNNEPGEEEIYYLRFPGSAALIEKLLDASKRYKTSMKHICFAAYVYMISMLSYENDILVGMISNNRPEMEDGEKLLGCFVNAVPFRLHIPASITCEDYIGMVDAKLHQIRPYEKITLYDIVKAMGERDDGENPLFDTIFGYTDFHIYKQAVEENHQGTGNKRISIRGYERTNTLLDFLVRPYSGNFMEMRYSTSFLSDRMAERLYVYFENILGLIISRSRGLIKKDTIMAEQEKQALLYDFNATDSEYPGGKTIHELFEEQVEQAPDHIALSGQTSINESSLQLTYRELNKRANRFALYLRKKEGGADTIVGIMMQRSVETVTAILGILKAGRVYMPIDPEYPAERIKFMLDDSNTKIILTTNRSLENYSFNALQGLNSEELASRCHKTAVRQQVTHLDSLQPVDRTLVDYENYHRYIGLAMAKHSIALQATRGCPYNCRYCHKIWPKRHVIRSAENIFNEVQQLYHLGIRRFAFIDDIFNLNIENSSRFFLLVIDNGLDLQLFFSNGVRGDILTGDYIDLMVKAGTVSMAIALETASPRLQKMIGKNLNLEKLRKNLEYLCKKHPQVILELFTMHGFPTETEEEALKTLEFIKSLEWLDFPYFHILKIYPNTDMARLAQEHGISARAIARSAHLAYHELPEILPFEKSFTLQCQSDFLNRYFLSKERLLHVLPYQMKILTEDEMVQKYNSYLPVEINSVRDLLEFAEIKKEELDLTDFSDDCPMKVPHLNQRLKKVFSLSSQAPREDALRILLLDLSQFFSKDTRNMLYDVVEPPLGLMYLLTALKKKFGAKINGKIAKSRIDFDDYAQLKKLVEDFKPDIIGLRTLTYYKDFFHKTAAMLRQWGVNVPLIAGGPYATSDYSSLLRDRNFDLVVLGEGEVTLCDIVSRVMENDRKLPGEAVLKEIPGICYIPKNMRKADAFVREVLVWDEFNFEPANEKEEQWDNLPVIDRTSDTAYVIYTSGTTGRPKGALIENRNVVRLLFNDKFQFDFDHSDVWTMFHSYCFDFSVWEMYGALLYGGKLVTIPKMVTRDPKRYLETLEREVVTVLNQTPSAFYNLANEAVNHSNQGKKLGIKYVIFGGEALKPKKLENWKEKYPAVKLINMFGITETTVHVTYKEIEAGEIKNNISNIGKPIPTLTTYVVDKSLNPLPIGVAGELCVGGEGVGRGYLNRVELTTEKFLDNPYNPYKQGDRLYKSGDLARFLENGDMEYLGRIDHQVKIRGFRIELGEIEKQLEKKQEIKEAVVVPGKDENGDTFLNAYIVPHPGTISQVRPILKPAALREYLLGYLPDYMIPAWFSLLEELPLTVNGKIDIKALPAPLFQSGEEYSAPRNEIEKKLVEIWESVLGVNNIGINDNFFALGGDSIKTIQISSRMNMSGYKLELQDIFMNPEISSLAPLVKKQDRTADQSAVTGNVPLTPIQQWFFQNIFSHNHHFNLAVMLYSREGFDKKILEAVFSRIQEHHDSLRMTYKINNGEIIQVAHGLDYPLSLEECDLKNHENGIEELNAKVNGIQSGIHLENGPLMKLGLFHLDDGDRLLIVVHHLVMDGVSWRILFEDIQALYEMYKKGEKPALPPKTDSFKLWGEKLSAYANSKTFLKEKTYWQKIAALEIPPIPKDFEVDENYVKDTRNVSFALGEKETGLLLTKVNQAFGTEINDILLAAFGSAIKKTFGSDRLLITLEGHGREQITESIDISRTVGWFTSIYPVVLDVSYGQNTGRHLKEIKETLRRVPNKGVGYGILKYLTEEENKKDIKFELKPQISFNYLGQFDADVNRFTFCEIAREPVGNTQSLNGRRKYDLDVVGMISNNRLGLRISYNEKHFKGKTMEILVDRFHAQLQGIIPYCTSRETMELTPSDFTYKGLSIDTVDRLKAAYPDIEDLYKLTPMQEGMLYHTLVDNSSYNYFEQLSFRMQGELKISLVKKCLEEISRRHDILRTLFLHKESDIPFQVVLKNRVIEFYYQDISQIEGPGEKENFLKEFKEKDKQRSFDLSKDVLMRVAIFRSAPRLYEFIWSHHHILMDGWCMGILNVEFFEIYNSYLEKRPYRLPVINPYRTYIKWLEKQDKEASARYWQNYLESYEESAVIPRTSTVKGEEEVFRNEKVSFALSREKTEAINRLAAESQVTLNTFLQVVWGILLGKYNGKEDVVFGAVVSGRPYQLEGVEMMVGLFINTIPVRIRFEERTKFKQLVQRIQFHALAGEPHHYHPLADIQSKSPLKQHLIDHLFIFENYPLTDQIEALTGERQEANESPIKIIDAESFEQTNYDFDVVLSASDQIRIDFHYNGNVYNADFISRMPGHFRTIADQVVENQEIEIRDIELLSGEEKNRLLNEFNDTGIGYPKDKTIHELFEEQVERTPDRIVLVGEENPKTEKREIRNSKHHLTYAQLNQSADGLAFTLVEKGVKPGSVIAILVERSVAMIVGIIGILKTGGVYLPIGPDYPKERVDFMLKDSGAKFLITPSPSQPLKFLTSKLANPSNASYIIYTSGSTGKPKGVVVSHSALVNRLYYIRERFQLDQYDINLQKTAFTFDVSVCEVFRGIVWGAGLVVGSETVEQDMEELIQTIQRHRLTGVDFVPTMLILFLDHIDDWRLWNSVRSLRRVFVGVEKLNVGVVKRFRQVLYNRFGTKLINAYGPTETTVDVTWYDCTANDVIDIPTDVPIGSPIANTRVYIVDCKLDVQPLGVPGELCIAGACLALGYLNNPELTKEKFVLAHSSWHMTDGKNSDQETDSRIDPMSDVQSSMSFLYKTGDLARWFEDGNIEFMGRVDRQIKIRGFRIELGEIESQLQDIEGIKQALVIDWERESHEKYLCAYFVAEKSLDPGEIKDILGRRLLDYMIPSHFIPIERVPLTANGKVDLKRLPKPEMKFAPDNYTAPRNSFEKELVRIWSEVLGIEKEKISIHDNFFHLGGHSLKATILAGKIHKEMDVNIPLPQIFKTSSILGLAEFIEHTVKSQFKSIEPQQKKEYYFLSSAQKRMYFLQQINLENTAYNMSEIHSLAEGTEIKKLTEIFERLIERHESLRTSFQLVDSEPVQKVHENVDFSIDHFEAAGEDEMRSIARDFIRSFDLSTPPLLRAGLIILDQAGYLLVDMHHIICDAVSHQILMTEFLMLYKGERLAPIRFQYKDFSEWQNRPEVNAAIKNQEDYWLEEFAGEIPVLKLPTDYAKPTIQSIEGNFFHFEISGENIYTLDSIASGEEVTRYMVLLALINIFCSKLSGQEDIVIGTPTAGRLHADLNKIIGLFVNTLALRNYPAAGKTFREFLRQVKEKTLKALDNQEYHFEDLVEKVKVTRDTSRSPLFDVMLNYLDVEAKSDSWAENRNKMKNDKKEAKPREFVSLNTSAKFDLTFEFTAVPGKLLGSINYSTQLFKLQTIGRLFDYFNRILSQVGADAAILLSDIEILSPLEKERLLVEFNRTETPYPREKTIGQMVEEQVERTPDRIALNGLIKSKSEIRNPKLQALPGQINTRSEMQLSYQQLNKKSNQLAYQLQTKGTKPDTIVGVMGERSIEMIVGILAILKAGSAYLPIDPNYPEERVNYMLEDSGARILLAGDTRNTGKPAFNNTPGTPVAKPAPQVLYLSAGHHPIFPASRLPGFPTSLPASLAYIIYTSGSTGKPKGVLVEHRSLVNAATWQSSYYNINERDHVSQYAPVVFDASVLEIFPCLIQGAALHIVHNRLRTDPGELNRYYEQRDITIGFLPTQFCEQFMDLENNSLRVLLAAGDKLQKFISRGYQLYNNYGPTENTVVTTAFLASTQTRDIPIGKPIQNNRLYILNPTDLHLQPIGVVGELYIGGESLARGYLNRPELTAAKFKRAVISHWSLVNANLKRVVISSSDKLSKVTNDQCPMTNDRLYKTGDLARWLGDGNIEFLGRIDSQVKIRGNRIELGEIEQQLQQIAGIKKAAVIDRQRKSGEKYLCAYFVAEKPVDTGELRNALGKFLPGYMVPSQLKQLQRIPLTPNGKVDKQALLALAAEVSPAADFIAPKSKAEKIIAQIWMETLDLDKVGAEDNFFEVGGTSMDIIRVTNRMKKALNRDIPMVHIFQYPNISALAGYFDQEENERGFTGDKRDEAVKRGKKDRVRRLQKKKGKE